MYDGVVTDYSPRESSEPIAKIDEPALIGGRLHVSEGGITMSCNDFAFRGIRRFYTMSSLKANVVRAWYGSKKETKYLFVTRGTALVYCAPLSAFDVPDGTKIRLHRFVLSERQPGVLYIPAGYACGHMALVDLTDILQFSTMTEDESALHETIYGPTTIDGVWDR